MSQTKAQLLNPQGDFTLTGQLIGVGATFSGNVSIAGTLTKQDVTNVDSVGVVTARSGVNISGGNLQVGGTNVINSSRALYNLDSIKLADSKELKLGSSDDLKIYHNGSHSYIDEVGNGALKIKGDDIRFENASAVERLRITSGGQVAIGTDTAETGYILTMSGDLSLGEKNGNSNTFIDQKQDGDLHLINSGRTAQGGSGTPGTAGVGINRYNNISGGTSLFRDFTVYNGKDSKVLVVDGSTSRVGVGTDTPTRGPLHVHENSTGDVQIHLTNQETGTTSSDGFTIFSGANAGPNAGFVNRESGGTIAFYTHNGSSVGVRLTLSQTGNLTSTGIIADSKGNVRSIVQRAPVANYTLVADDAGRHVIANGYTITVPNQIFSSGDAITIINNHASNAMTITCSAPSSVFKAGDATAVTSITLNAKGMVTFLCNSGSSGSNSQFFVSGAGMA